MAGVPLVTKREGWRRVARNNDAKVSKWESGKKRERERVRGKEKQRGAEVGVPWHVLALVHSTNESKTHGAG